MRHTFVLCALSMCWVASSASAAGILNEQVEGNVYRAQVSLIGPVQADLTITFESVEGLDPSSLDVSARLIGLNDLTILGRLPPQNQIPVAFPVVLTVAPAAGSSLSFRGVARVELHTHLLDYLPGSPLRLVSAPPGQPFSDETAEAGAGSYRVGGRTPDFSRDYMILIDPRSQSANVAWKLDWLESTLTRNAGSIDPAVANVLGGLITAIRQDWTGGSAEAAQAKTTALETLVEVYSGTAIPNRWQAGDPTANAAGELRSATGTLSYSLLQGGAGDD